MTHQAQPVSQMPAAPVAPPAPASPAEPDLTSLYVERAHILALLALNYYSYLAYSDISNPEWPVLTMETPQGQLSWHVTPDQLDLFRHVKWVNNEGAAAAYDGHSSADRHARIRARVESFLPLTIGT